MAARLRLVRPDRDEGGCDEAASDEKFFVLLTLCAYAAVLSVGLQALQVTFYTASLVTQVRISRRCQFTAALPNRNRVIHSSRAPARGPTQLQLVRTALASRYGCSRR